MFWYIYAGASAAAAEAAAEVTGQPNPGPDLEPGVTWGLFLKVKFWLKTPDSFNLFGTLHFRSVRE